MSTTSSKLRNKKSVSAAKKDRAAPSFSSDAGAPALGKMSDATYRLLGGAILIVSAFLRLFYLTLVPLHHDEGVNGNFLVTLVRDGKYIYDPQNYHGPTLYFFSSLIPWLARFFGGVQARDAYGLTTFNIRLVTALFGIATIWLVLMLRKRLGSIGALSAAVLIRISPGAIYLSRYFIHETLFVFFMLGIVVAALRYYDTANSVYMILAAISAGLMFATKETWIINGPLLLIALATTQLYFVVRKKLGDENSVEEASPPEIASQSSLVANVTLMAFAMFMALTILFVASFNQYKNSIWIWISVVCLIGATLYFVLQPRRSDPGANAELQTDSALARFGGAVPLTTVVLVAFAVFILVNVLFYSSFFTNYPKGVSDALKTLNLWRQRTHEHEHPFLQYFEWLRQIESPLLLLGAAGAVVAVWRADNRFAVFSALWAFGLLLAYSLVGYKTPWISLNFVVPLALISGYALKKLWEGRDEPWLPLLLIGGAIALLVFRHLLSPRYGDNGEVVGVAWDFDFSHNGIYIAGVILLALYAGFVLYSRQQGKLSPHFITALILALTLGSYQLYQLNFVHYDDDQLPYVYAHTKRQMLTMIDRVEIIAQKNGTGTDTGVAIVSPYFWPLPWYFRNYKKVVYSQQIVPTNEPIIIGSKAQEEQLQAEYSNRYDVINSGEDEGAYPLRPGVDLLLLVRRDLKR